MRLIWGVWALLCVSSTASAETARTHAEAGLCRGRTVRLVESSTATYHLDDRGGLSADRFGDSLTFELPALPDVLVRATVGDDVIACQTVARDGPRRWRIDVPSSVAEDAVVTLEVFRFGPPNETRAKAARALRARALVEAILFAPPQGRAHRADRERDLRSLLLEAIETRNDAWRDDLIDAAKSRELAPSELVDAIPTNGLRGAALREANELNRLRALVRDYRDAYHDDLDALRTTTWTARERAEALPEVTPIEKAKEILTWYLTTPIALHPSRILRHRLPARASRTYAAFGSSRRVVRWGRQDADDAVDRRGRRVALVVTHVPRATTPRFRENQTATPRPDVATPLLTFLGPLLKAQVLAALFLDVPPPGSTLARVVDPALPTEARVETHTFVSRPVQSGTSLSLWVCDGDCPTSDGEKVRNRVSVDGDRLFGLLVLASVGVGYYTTRDRLTLREVGGGQPDRIYRVTRDPDRTALFGSVGLGVRVWNFVVSANVLSVGRDVPTFRSWLFGAGFRVRRLSEHTYLQLLGGFARPEIFDGVSAGQFLASPDGTTPSLETRRRRVPMLGLAFSFDIVGLGSAAASLAKTVGAN